MSLKLNTKYLNGAVSDAELRAMQSRVNEAVKTLDGVKDTQPVGWRTLPADHSKEEFSQIVAASEKIKSLCGKDGALVVIGIGGSYLGARAAIEFVKSQNYNLIKKDTPDVFFVGNTLSAEALDEIYDLVKDRSVCLNVISKSGNTTEPALAFRIFRKLIVEKYGKEGARDRIFVTTDKNGKSSKLKAFADAEGYETFIVPDNIGGRYSVLTPVGLLPIAVAGIDIQAMMDGAYAAMNAYTDTDIEANDCYKYAAIRNVLYEKEKSTEIFVAYDPALALTAEWWKQLYGESEGKDHKGIYPSSVINTTDLHSLGQYIQQGRRFIFETVIDVVKSSSNRMIENDPDDLDGLNFLSGKSLDEINKTAFRATVLAHNDGDVPNLVIEIDDRSAYSFGYMVYFFELACAISGYILGVNPFDQPGVEAYKDNMYALLGKPGVSKTGVDFKEMKVILEERMK